LTIKFTQYTGQSAFGTQHSAKSLQPIAYRLLLIARSAFQLYVPSPPLLIAAIHIATPAEI
jgi:hypothetical protein